MADNMPTMDGRGNFVAGNGKIVGHYGSVAKSYTREEWEALTEAQKHGLDLPVESPEDQVRFSSTVRDDEGNEYSAEATGHPSRSHELIARVQAELTAKCFGARATTETIRPSEAPVLKVVGGTDAAPPTELIGGATPAAASIGDWFRPVLEAFARTCIGVAGKAALCGYGENPETGKKLRHHIVHVLNDVNFVDHACAAVRKIASEQGRNVYFPSGLISLDVVDNGNERGKEDSVMGRWCIALEFDKGGHKALNVASRLPLPAQFLIQSSVQGIHAIYVLDRPYTVAETQPVLDALVKVIKGLIEETPFVGGVARAVALSMILTALVRRTLPTAPLHAVSAHMAGSGKSYLADIAATIATGGAAPVFSQGANDEEFEKRLVVNLMLGDAVVSIDNCDRPLSGAFLNMVLTQPTVRARILGQSKMVEMPSNAFVLATGNNLRVKEDMTRRVLISEIDPRRENPELRVFKKNPVAMIQRDRVRYVVAGLTVLRAYEVAGRPARRGPLGSFEAWSLLVRDALIWLGEADPVESQEGARASDPTRQYLLAVLTQWRRVFGNCPVRVSEVVTKAAVDAELREPLAAVAAPFARSAELIDPRRLGEYLRARKGEIVGGMSIQDVGARGGSNLWALQVQ